MSTRQRASAVLLGGLLLLWASPTWCQNARAEAALPGGDGLLAALESPPGGSPPVSIPGAYDMPEDEPPVGADPGFDPIERAWFAAAGSLEDRVKRTLHSALELGRPSLEGPARALLLEESFGTPLERAEAAVRLAPDLPAARIALAKALWSEEWDLLGALDQLRHAARASARHLEASVWLRATILQALVTGCLIGSLLFLFVVGGSLVATAARALAELPGSVPTASRVALLAGLLLIPAVLGEGLFGVALAFAALGFWRGSAWQRVAVGAALIIAIAGLHPLVNRAGEELVALGSDPVGEAAFVVEHARPSRTDIDRLERAAAGDPLVARALALRAKRNGDLEDADRRFAALIEQSDRPSPSLLNNAANVRLALDRSEEAIRLYEAAARKSHSVVVLFNLSQAYGRLVQLDRQDLALAEAQLIDPPAIGELSNLYAGSRQTLVQDLPVETESVRLRLGAPAAARQVATALRRRFAPGWLGVSAVHSTLGVAIVALLGSLVAVGLRRVTGGGEGSDLYAGIARLLTGSDSTDPVPRTVRLAALRKRQARIDKITFLLSLTVPGAAGVLSRHPILGLLASMLFASTLACWWARDGVAVDPLAVGAGPSLLFGALAIASALAYAAVVAATIALRERS